MTREDQLFARFAQDAQSKNQSFQETLKDKDSAFHYTKSVSYDVIHQYNEITSYVLRDGSNVEGSDHR